MVTKRKPRQKHEDTGVLLDGMTLDFLDATIDLLFSENSSITRFNFLEMYKFFKKIETIDLQDDYNKFLRVLIAKKVLKRKLDFPSETPEVLLQYVVDNSPKYSEDIAEYFENGTEEVSTDTVKSIIRVYRSRNNKAESMLLFEKFVNSFDKFRMGDIDDEEQFCQDKLIPLLSKLQSALTYSEDEARCTSFDFSRDSLMNIATKFIAEKKNPSFKARTGFKVINAMTNGGYEPRRLYLYLGAPGRFKSGNQLNQIISCFRHNNNIVTEDKTKKPCYVYITYENSLEETFERVFEYSLGENITDAELSDPRNWNPEELTKAFHEDGLNDGKAQVFFLYRKPYTQSVTEIREEIKLCEGDKYQCVGVFLDYVEKINTIDKSLFRDNEYARLGVVTSELAAFGKETNRFIVTSAQLNRASIAKLEE